MHKYHVKICIISTIYSFCWPVHGHEDGDLLVAPRPEPVHAHLQPSARKHLLIAMAEKISMYISTKKNEKNINVAIYKKNKTIKKIKKFYPHTMSIRIDYKPYY